MNSVKRLYKWLKIRKELYRQMAAEVQHRLGRETKDLARYRQEYDGEFKKKWQAASKMELVRAIKSSRLILMGDFHALQQSQKAHLRILKSLPPQTPIVLAVECFEAEDQKFVNSFLLGSMNEREFLLKIKWPEKWGFPWDHYRPLFLWAQKHKVQVYGLNKSGQKKSASQLKMRDQFAAKKINEILNKHPEHCCFVIYGDLHLAKKHLPAEVLKRRGLSFRSSMLRIFQNAEKIYFQLLAQELEASVDIVRLGGNDFCLMSVPPWVKWQNYLMYLEQAYDLELDDDHEEALDYTDYVGRYVKIMAEELGVPVSLGNLSVYTAEDPFLWKNLEEKLSVREIRWIEKMVEEQRSFYMPEIDAAYLARASVNHAASLAMQYIHAQLSGRVTTPMHMPKDFLRQIWIEGLAYFGSKMINHKRKSDTIADIKISLTSRNSLDMGKEALRLSLQQKMQELMIISGRSHPGGSSSRQVYSPKNKWSYMQSSTLLGGILGEKLYNGYRSKVISPTAIVQFLKNENESESFRNSYFEMLETIEALPTTFRSKQEKL